MREKIFDLHEITTLVEEEEEDVVVAVVVEIWRDVIEVYLQNEGWVLGLS